MAKDIKWPKSLEACRIADHVCATAYEAARAEQRACLKNAIAFQARHGQCPTRIESFTEDASKGYWQRSVCAPVPWTLVFCTATYASPSRFVAALMPVLLAQVPLVGVVSVGGEPSASLLLAMELMGVEESFVLPNVNFATTHNTEYFNCSNDAHALCRYMANFGQGRVLLLHEGSLAELHGTLRELRISFWEECVPPYVHVGRLVDIALLSWAQADVLCVQESAHMLTQKKNQTSGHSAIKKTCCSTSPIPYAAFGLDASESSVAQYVWECGMEGCWQHAELTTHFFQHCQKTAGVVTCEEYCHGD